MAPGLIQCGWCGHTTSAERCSYCGRNPTVPWEHRDLQPPTVEEPAAGRPTLEAEEVRGRLAEARQALGPHATNAALAEHLGVAESTVRRWRKVAD